MKKYLLPFILSGFVSVGLSAQTISFGLLGKGGAGLLPSNSVAPIVSSASGGEIGSGIFFDTSTSMLTVNIGWGSANGFTDLLADMSVAHIHGPADFNSTGGVAINLGPGSAFTFDPSATAGTILGTVDTSGITDFQSNLESGLYYINIHTSANPGGEIRGNLVAIPEPSALGLLAGLGALGLVVRRRR